MTATIILGICLIASLAINAATLWLMREERRELIDRVMSLSQPIALTTFKSARTPVAADVSYVDETREYDLNPPPDLSEVP